jgi:hypothetical protein
MNRTEAVEQLRSMGYEMHQASAILDEAWDWGRYSSSLVTVTIEADSFIVRGNGRTL